MNDQPANQPAKANDNQTAKKTASRVYAQRRLEIARLMHVVEMELETHAQRAASDENNWGYAGDLDGIRDDLKSFITKISGHSAEAIETFLEDAADAN